MLELTDYCILISLKSCIKHLHSFLLFQIKTFLHKIETCVDDIFLYVQVTEESPLIPRHTVGATVNVTVKEIPEEAVDKSGSIRLYGTSAEDFITPDSVSTCTY